MTTPTDNLATSHRPADADEPNPTLLTEAELDHVAAAGSKPGASSGSGAPLERPVHRPP